MIKKEKNIDIFEILDFAVNNKILTVNDVFFYFGISRDEISDENFTTLNNIINKNKIIFKYENLNKMMARDKIAFIFTEKEKEENVEIKIEVTSKKDKKDLIDIIEKI